MPNLRMRTVVCVCGPFKYFPALVSKSACALRVELKQRALTAELVPGVCLRSVVGAGAVLFSCFKQVTRSKRVFNVFGEFRSFSRSVWLHSAGSLSSLSGQSVANMEEANKLVGAGKKFLVMGKVVEAVSALQEACDLL